MKPIKSGEKDIITGAITRQTGTPVWQCPKCKKKYQKKSMCQSHILNKHNK